MRSSTGSELVEQRVPPVEVVVIVPTQRNSIVFAPVFGSVCQLALKNRCGLTQTLPVPHVCGLEQLPQLAVRAVPQLSAALTVPQFLPSREQKAALVSGTQAQTLID